LIDPIEQEGAVKLQPRMLVESPRQARFVRAEGGRLRHDDDRGRWFGLASRNGPRRLGTHVGSQPRNYVRRRDRLHAIDSKLQAVASWKPFTVRLVLCAAMDARLYERYLRSPDGRLRCELLWDGVISRLPKRRGLTALDAGGGTGELAERLAGRGVRVTLVDRSPEMLQLAGRRLQGRAHVIGGDVADGHVARGARFDVVTCHLVIEYTDDPRRCLNVLASKLAPKGLFSLAFRTPGGEAMKRALAGAYSRSRTALRGGSFAGEMLGKRGVLLPVERVHDWVRAAGLQTLETRNVRVFPVQAPRKPGAFGDLLRLERAVARDPGWVGAARYAQILATRSP
jgi:S-adenosylmethionine-dependent methyltransferase